MIKVCEIKDYRENINNLKLQKTMVTIEIEIKKSNYVNLLQSLDELSDPLKKIELRESQQMILGDTLTIKLTVSTPLFLFGLGKRFGFNQALQIEQDLAEINAQIPTG